MAARKDTGPAGPAKKTRGSAQGGRSRKSPGAPKKPRVSWAVLFWLVFAIFIFGLFLFNQEPISRSIQIIRDTIAARKVPAEGELSAPDAPNTAPAEPAPEEPSAPARPTVTPAEPAAAPTEPVTEPPEPPAGPPAAAPPEPAPGVGTRATQPTRPTQPAGTQPSGAGTQAARNTTELRSRTLYFTEVDRGGSILRVKSSRELPVSDSPMTDVLQALLAGPSAEEKREGLISLIPSGSRILSATVRGNTAYINFSEDFRYNTYGVEGYAGQLRQIVFTATEFPNVRDVQILIEGQRVDYLGEGIWIGSPISRDML